MYISRVLWRRMGFRGEIQKITVGRGTVPVVF